MEICEQSIEAIVVAVLAVNNYGIENAYNLLPALRDAGLTDPAQVAGKEMGGLTVRLAQAGYNRGLLTEMMAGRLQTLMNAVKAGKLDSFDSLVASGDRVRALPLLCEIRGIGPQVAANAWSLLKG